MDYWAYAPLLVIALCIVVFLEIHPFQDGNGRLSRALTTLLLLQAGYAYVPYSSLESVLEQNKEAYYLALRQTQGTIRLRVQPALPLRAQHRAVQRSRARSGGERVRQCSFQRQSSCNFAPCNVALGSSSSGFPSIIWPV